MFYNIFRSYFKG